MTHCLVTGGAGFIGQCLVRALRQAGSTVRVLDDFSSGKQEGLPDDVLVMQGDVSQAEHVDAAVDGVDVIFHLAARVSVPESVKNPLANHTVNATGTMNVLQAAAKHKVSRVVYAASSSCYGETPPHAIAETAPLQPLSPYAATKLTGELYCQCFDKTVRPDGPETVRLRFFNVFGPGQDPNSPYAAVIPAFLTAMAAGKPPTIFGDGQQARDFVFVDDVVQALINASKAPADQVSGKVFNIGTGTLTTLLDLVAILNQQLGTSLAPNHAEPRLGDILISLADVSAARDHLGFTASTSLAEGLKKCVESS